MDFRSPIPRSATPVFKWRILVVDDEAGMVESLRMLLTQMGYEVSTALDGHSATEELRRNDYDLVITDLMMDGSTGYDILDFVSSEQLNIPVLVLTGLGSVDAAVKALKQGAYDYILKPFQFDSFRSCVRRAIEKRQLELIQRLQNQRLTAVASIAKAVTSTLNLDEIFQIIVNQSREFVEFSSAALALIDEHEQCIDLFTLLLDRHSTPQFRHRIPSGFPFFAELFERRSAVIVSDAAGRVPAGDSGLVLCDGANSFVFVPLLVKDRLVGAMFFGSKSEAAYHHQEVQLLSLMADQIAVAVDNARLLDLEQRRSRQLELINSIGKRLTTALVVEKLIETAVVLLRDYFPQRRIDIFCFDEAKQSLVRTQQTGSEQDKNGSLTQASGQGAVGRAAETGATAVFSSRETGEKAAGTAVPVELAVPLKSEGEVLGVLAVEDTAGYQFTDSEIAFFEAVASQIALAWRNARLFEQIRKSKIYLELVLNAADDTSIMSIDPEGRIITFNSGSETLLGLSAEEAVGRPIHEVIVSRRMRAIFNNLGKSRDCVEEEVRISSLKKRSFWARIVIRPIEPAVDLYVGFLIILTNVTQRVRLERKLKQLTVTDDLTGLYNQRHFFQQLRREMERASRRGTRFSMCMFDLDKFKRYNDTQGHLAGDHLLKAIGKRVAKEIRAKIDTAFRYGGDEFVLILPDTSLSQAASLVDRLRTSVQREFEGAIGISAGIVEYAEGQSEKEFIEAADQLLYEAKRQGGNRAVYRLARTYTQS
ncbi:MAG TPA: diguanylate cyclase [Terriglobia bacterium]|nr:diguanylate cyclase [Terriglobia bacterium]